MEDAVIITNKFSTPTGATTFTLLETIFGKGESRVYEIEVLCNANTNKSFSATYRFLLKAHNTTGTVTQVGATSVLNTITDTDLSATALNLLLATNTAEVVVAGIDAEAPLAWSITTKYWVMFQSGSTTFDPTA